MRFFRLVGVSAGVVLCVATLDGQTNEGQKRLSPADVQIVAQTAKQSAYGFSLAAWCTSKNRNGLQQYAMAVAAWQQRNHWKELEAGPVKTELAPGEYEGLKKEAFNEFNAHAFKSTFLCAGIANVLRQPEHDPSQQYGAELSRIAAASVAVAPPAVTAQGNANTGVSSAGAGAVSGGASPQGGVVGGSNSSSPQQGSVGQAASQEKATVQGGVPPAAPVAASGPVTVGDASITPPAGWTVSKSATDQAILQKSMVTMVRTSRAEAKLLVSLTVQPMQGGIDQAFPAAVRRNFPGPPMELKYISKGVTRGGLQARTVRDGGRLNLPGNPRARVRAVGVALPDGRLFVAMILMRSDWESLMSKADDEFEEMVVSLRLASQPEASLWDFNRPPKGSGGQKGLYWANGLINMPNAFGGMDLRAERYYVMLFANGQAYSELPEDGHVDDMNFTALCQKRPKNCGTYDISGGQIHFKWLKEYGLVEETQGPWSAGDKGGLDTNGHHYTRILPVHGLRVSGRYTSTFASVGSIGGQSNSVVSEKYITFTPDGRYQKSGFAGASFDSSSAAGTFASKKSVTAGTYRIEGYTLTLTPNGGSPELYSVIFEDPSPSPKAIFINDDSFLRSGS